MKQTLCFLSTIMLVCCIVVGCKGSSKPSETKWKPWSATPDSAQLTPDSIDSLTTLSDTMLVNDSLVQADSIAHADSLRRTAADDTHQILQGHAGDKDVYLNFSTINGTHIMGNALFDGRQIEIAGTYMQSKSSRTLRIEETRAVHDSTRIRIDATSTATGYEGTLYEGPHPLPLSLER